MKKFIATMLCSMNEAAQQIPIVSMDRLVTESSRLYSLPDIYLKVKNIITDPESELSELGDALMTDPSLSARLLRIANSAFYGLSNKVDTISRKTQPDSESVRLYQILATTWHNLFATQANTPAGQFPKGATAHGHSG